MCEIGAICLVGVFFSSPMLWYFGGVRIGNFPEKKPVVFCEASLPDFGPKRDKWHIGDLHRTFYSTLDAQLSEVTRRQIGQI